MALLVDQPIPLGVCPTSNLRLSVYAAIDAHPIGRLRLAGVAVSLNADDPVLLGASLEGEYALCSQAFGWSDEDLRALARNPIDASFADGGGSARGFGALVGQAGCEPRAPGRECRCAAEMPGQGSA